MGAESAPGDGRSCLRRLDKECPRAVLRAQHDRWAVSRHERQNTWVPAPSAAGSNPWGQEGFSGY